ncbi:sugar ABC transporter substrate-binding protein [Cerasicoccus maritimus]|uniref:sugar ABC transporter substrate-binding protein n=1 Tax=Cerasicoccus maritimus TaxID=490089 RepID=UPI002852B60C|nr:substrate-binding domain-containing protein [Cerasicoccus maritimus]
MFKRLPIFAVLFALILSTAGLHAARPREIWERYSVAYIGERKDDSSNGPIIAGARAEADVLEHQYHLAVTILDLTPAEPNDQKESLRQAYLQGVKAVLIRPVDAASIQDQLDTLQKQGIGVVTLDGDVPETMRLMNVHTDESALAQLAFDEAKKRLPRRGRLAILAGDAGNPISAERLATITAAAEADSKVTIRGVYPCQEDVSDAFNVLRQVEAADRDETIDGWIFVGPWPLKSAATLPWRPGEKVCISIEALPPNLAYLASQQVDALIAEEYVQWGKIGMNAAIQFVQKQEMPEMDQTTGGSVISGQNLDQVSQDWADWLL